MNFGVHPPCLFVGVALLIRAQGKHPDSSGLFLFPLAAGRDRTPEDGRRLGLYIRSRGSVTQRQRWLCNGLLQNSKNKDPITIFALIILDVAVGKGTFCRVPFVGEINYKEMTHGPFSYKAAASDSCGKSCLREKGVCPVSLWKGRQGERRGRLDSLGDFVVSSLLFLDTPQCPERLWKVFEWAFSKYQAEAANLVAQGGEGLLSLPPLRCFGRQCASCCRDSWGFRDSLLAYLTCDVSLVQSSQFFCDGGNSWGIDLT